MIDNLIPAIPVPVMPESYDLSLSYMELLMTCVNKLNAMIKLVNDETAAMNEVKEQINQILPYLDDLAHMGERFAAIQGEIDALRNQLYAEDTGDITQIRASILDITRTIGSLAAKLQTAYALALQNKVAAGTNVLHETWHTTNTTHRGITITYSPGTGWFHLTGVLTAPPTQGTTTTVTLAKYTIKEPFKTILTELGELSSNVYQSIGRFWARPLVSPDTIEHYAELLWFELDDSMFAYPFDGLNTTTIVSISGSENTLKIRFAASAVNANLDLWVCPSMEFTPTIYDNDPEYFPSPSNADTAIELRNRITAEAASRVSADETEALARTDAFNQVNNRLTDEIEMRLSEDNQLAQEISNEQSARIAAIRAEETARTETDEGLQEQIDRRYTLGLGTAIVDPDPDNGVYADLFTLPIGKYYRSTNPGNVQNLPAGFTGGFACVVEAGVAGSRPVITLWKISGTNANAGEFFRNLKTASGYGDWYRYGGTPVVAT